MTLRTSFFIFFLGALAGCEKSPAEKIMPENPKPAEEAVVEITSPKEEELLPDGGKVEVHFRVKNMVLEKGRPGLWFVVDQGLPVRHDRLEPFILSSLTPGSHVLWTFPERLPGTLGENQDAFSLIRFYVAEKSGKSIVDPALPFLTAIGPQGVVSPTEDGEVVLDFHLRNAHLKPGAFRVRVSLDDGSAQILSSWHKVAWKELKPGHHAIKLELLDSGGALVKNGRNPIEWSFQVKQNEDQP